MVLFHASVAFSVVTSIAVEQTRPDLKDDVDSLRIFSSCIGVNSGVFKARRRKHCWTTSILTVLETNFHTGNLGSQLLREPLDSVFATKQRWTISLFSRIKPPLKLTNSTFALRNIMVAFMKALEYFALNSEQNKNSIRLLRCFIVGKITFDGYEELFVRQDYVSPIHLHNLLSKWKKKD